MDLTYSHIYINAATIDELLSDDFDVLPGTKLNIQLAMSRLMAWCKSSSNGDWYIFLKRLNRDGHKIEKLIGRFGGATVKNNAELPLWVIDSSWVLEAMDNPLKQPEDSNLLKKSSKYAFEDVYIELLRAASILLYSKVHKTANDHLSESAREDINNVLLKRLTDISAPLLYKYFDEYREYCKASSIYNKKNVNQNKIYKNFITTFVSDSKFNEALTNHPVLLRLISTIVRQWIEVFSALINRFNKDVNDLKLNLSNQINNQNIIHIYGDISDLHNSGNSVQILEFENGCKIVYKPKSCKIDFKINKLIYRLNTVSPPVSLRTAKIIDRNSYGWSEFVGNQVCCSSNASLYFRKAGAWLSIFHAFCSTDINHENIIADDCDPIPIDLEMLLQSSKPELKTEIKEKKANEIASDIIYNSVLMVGLLPTQIKSTDNTIFTTGGLVNVVEKEVKLDWENINTDSMKMIKKTTTSSNGPNLPIIDNHLVELIDFHDDFIEGFLEFGNFLIAVRDKLGINWFFDEFKRSSSRKIIRPTRFYHALINRVKSPELMRDGVIWSAQLDFIARFTDWSTKEDCLWLVNKEERKSLAELNIPIFFSDVSKDRLHDIKDFSIQTGANGGLLEASIRLQELNKTELQFQAEVIRATLCTNKKVKKTRASIENDQKQVQSEPKEFLKQASSICELIINKSIQTKYSAAWIGIDRLGDAGASQLLTLGMDLYGGTTGISLFLSAYYKVSGDLKAKKLALKCLAELQYELENANAQRLVRNMGVGGAAGLGSIIYALAAISKILNNNEILRYSKLAASFLSDELIASDKNHDVIGGSAGAILGLLKLYRISNKKWVLEIAENVGNHLLQQNRKQFKGKKSWGSHGGFPLNGMSHGAAGYSYSLYLLFSCTKNKKFLDAAKDFIEYENTSYDDEFKNWPDFRYKIKTECDYKSAIQVSQWCHGSIGIGLARIGILKIGGVKSNQLLADIQNALKGIEKNGWKNIDTLCCGALGAVEFLSEASTVFGNNNLREIATNELLNITIFNNATGDYRWSDSSNKFQNLGLFQGVSGIGYTMLRHLDSSLPNVLIWE